MTLIKRLSASYKKRGKLAKRQQRTNTDWQKKKESKKERSKKAEERHMRVRDIDKE